MKSNLKTLCPLACALLVLAGCGKSDPDPAALDRLAGAYAGVLAANEQYLAPGRVTKEEYERQRDSVLKACALTPEQFDAQMKAVFQSEDASRIFFAAVRKKLEQ